LDVVPDGSVTVALFTVRDTKPLPPNTSGASAAYLGISLGRAWFVAQAPLDSTTSVAGTSSVPSLSEPMTSLVDRSPGRLRLLFVCRDNTTAVCNVCEAPPAAAKAPPQPLASRGLVVVCGRTGSGKPQCTAPLSVKTGARVLLDTEDDLSVAEPGALPKHYKVTF
jgi:hypothetical protein